MMPTYVSLLLVNLPYAARAPYTGFSDNKLIISYEKLNQDCTVIRLLEIMQVDLLLSFHSNIPLYRSCSFLKATFASLQKGKRAPCFPLPCPPPPLVCPWSNLHVYTNTVYVTVYFSKVWGLWMWHLKIH